MKQHQPNAQSARKKNTQNRRQRRAAPQQPPDLHESYGDLLRTQKKTKGKRRQPHFGGRSPLPAVFQTLPVILVLLLLVCLGFILTETLLRLSDAPPVTGESESAHSETQTQEGQSTQPGINGNPLYALQVSPAVLRGGAALEQAMASARSGRQNAVVMDWKDENGNFYYPTGQTLAQQSGAAQNAAQNAAESLHTMQSGGLRVIARVYCFRDPLAAQTMREAAIHYQQEGMLWLDNAKESGGVPWLNPYSPKATEYLLSVIAEIAALRADYILLDGVQFANGRLSNAFFIGEDTAGAATRNETLRNFVQQAKQAAGSIPILLTMQSSAAFGGASALYDGDLWQCPADAFVIPLQEAELPMVASFTPAGKRVVPQIAAAREGEYILQRP